MKKEYKILLTLATYILIYLLGLFHGISKNNYSDKTLNTNEYKTIELDSITYKIVIKDSLIYHLKIQSNEAIRKSYSISDSDAVVLFKQLTSE